MKRLVVAVTTGALLGLGVVPNSVAAAGAAAQAAQTVVTVHGFAYPASLSPLSRACPGGSSTVTQDPYYLSGGARGTHATGYRFSGPGSMAGVQAYVATPRSLDAVAFRTYHPAAPVNGAARDGQLVAYFDPYDAGFADGYYVGSYDLDSTVGGWSSWTGVEGAEYDWAWWDGTSLTDSGFSGTLSEIAVAEGTDGGGAWLGFAFGCDGRQYFMDDLRLTTAAGTTIYDFEAVASRSSISSNVTHRSRTLKRDLARIALVHGQNHFLYGDSVGISDGAVWGPAYPAGRRGYLEGRATLWAKPYGGGWRAVGARDYTADTYGRFEIRPARRTLYQVRTRPTSHHLFAPSVSRVLTVTVERRVWARVGDREVRRGGRIAVTGRIRPGDRGVALVLQRRTAKGWRTVARSRSGKAGRYVLRARARTTGRWTLRVKVAAAKGVEGTVSPRIRVRVVPPPPPRRAPVRKPAPVPVPVPVRVVNPAPVTHTPLGGTRLPQPPESHTDHRLATGAARRMAPPAP